MFFPEAAGVLAVSPTKDTAVKTPSKMIATGDAVIHNNFVLNNYYGSVDLSSGLWWMRHYVRSGTLSSFEANAQRVMTSRHRKKVVIAFCDGHVEFLSHKIFFTDDDDVLRGWNLDNQPHREAYYPSLPNP
jgi:prepilin-type processing-associated H-X9-DG protein